MSNAQLVAYALLAGAGLWVLHTLGRALTKLLEAAAAVAVVFVTLWLIVQGAWKTLRWLWRHPRTTLTTAGVGAWWHWWGLPSLGITLAVVAAGLGCGGGAGESRSRPGPAGGCGPGGSAGSSTPRGCRAGCAPAG